MRKITFLLAAAVALAVACSDSAPTSPNVSTFAATAQADSTTVSNGARRPPSRAVGIRSSTGQTLQAVWGGANIGIMVAASGASVDYDCAAGSIDAPLVTDAAGRFDLPGTLWSYPPGPIPANWLPDKRLARYSGAISGNTMTLTVSLDKNETLQFTLARDTAPRMVHCQ